MADWGKLKTMLIYIKAANYTRQDGAFGSPNEGGAQWCDMHGEVRQITPKKRKKNYKNFLIWFLSLGKGQSILHDHVLHFVSTFGCTTPNSRDLVLFCLPKMYA